jgi:hypothetical protein
MRRPPFADDGDDLRERLRYAAAAAAAAASSSSSSTSTTTTSSTGTESPATDSPFNACSRISTVSSHGAASGPDPVPDARGRAYGDEWFRRKFVAT